ncbi:MAG: Fic family protein [Actinobacteria bacterium]|nr:Fic family protein [Actinomycetota bacterium]MCG2817881.1 Fic family protein [Actinomycetes bacterium]MBU4219782.1 Fic family protein [Actinomycetota bacterium]MBU4357810.1 Fic family protein [Actinomycetota bacterium]MBU4392637.1 Fic family protein [Actinomycetota bacterium]
MDENDQDKPTHRLAGYAALIDRYDLDVIPNCHRSFITTSGVHRIHSTGGAIEEVYSPPYWPGDTLGDHLEFALKYDGTNLAILASLFPEVAEEGILEYVRSKPLGKYARRLWFLYEFLTGKTLPLDDVKWGTYIDLLEPDEYYVVTPARQVRRQRINDNLLGCRRFCPTVRRTDTLRDFETVDLPKRCRQIVSAYSPELLKRALGYLYTKETRSSFEIEHIKPTSTRTERFVTLLQLAEQEDFCEKTQLIELQNRVVDPRFRDSDYRLSQNYVGETIAWQKEKIHFACPKPEDLPDLMEGLVTAHKRMDAGNVSAVIHAAAIAYGFVFLHPFEDGNGRIHRFLIHNILARRSFTPEGVMFPVSAPMLKYPADYDASLEAFSRHLMALVEHSLDEEGLMTVHNDTARWYRYIDITPQAEALFRFIDQTIDTELARELEFLASYDETKRAIQEIVDMPDRKIDLFIRFCLQNNGRLSARKRLSHFDFLSDEEISLMEQAVQAAY